MSSPVRRMTVSEFIRESKPDWEHVSYQEDRASTGKFSGPLTVQIQTPRTSLQGDGTWETVIPTPYEEQMAEHMRQINKEEIPWTEAREIRQVNDLVSEHFKVIKKASRVPR